MQKLVEWLLLAPLGRSRGRRRNCDPNATFLTAACPWTTASLDFYSTFRAIQAVEVSDVMLDSVIVIVDVFAEFSIPAERNDAPRQNKEAP
jgi:hypothetical protein